MPGTIGGLAEEAVIEFCVEGAYGLLNSALPWWASMTINRKWLAREWLYLLGGLVWAYVLLPIAVPPLARLVFWVWPRLYSPGASVAWSVRVSLGPDSLLAFGPYVICQVVRITIWAIRTLREAK